MRQLPFIVISLLLLSSCEKEIDLNLDDKSGNIVIEGNITNQPSPYYMQITKSVAFTEINQYPPITDAVVIVSDNTGQVDTLQYVADGRYKTTSLISLPGNTYHLLVIADGVSYTAQSTMPQTVALGSFIQDSISIGRMVNYSILPVFTDPMSLGNRYLFILSVNGRKGETPQLFSDNINNGMVNQRTLMLPMNGNDNVKIGETVHVEMQCIDQSIYTYYTAVNQISGSGGSGTSVTPANPPSNISNDALGYFSAHTVMASDIIIR